MNAFSVEKENLRIYRREVGGKKGTEDTSTLGVG